MPSTPPPPPVDLVSLARRLGPWVLLAILPFLLTIPALPGGWILDDRFLVAQDARVHDLGAYRAWFSTSLFDAGGSGTRLVGQMAYYRPLVPASFAIDWLWGLGSPLTFHLTNGVLAGVAAVLAARALRRWSGADALTAPVLVAALLWAAHPAHADSVAWISGRPDLLLSVGMLLASAGIARRLAGAPRGVGLEIAGTLVAYLAKESAVTLPALAALEALAARRRGQLSRAAAARAVLPQLGVAVAYLAARLVWMPLVGASGDAPPVLARLARVLETYGRYAVLAVWPSDLTLFRAAVRGAADAPAISTPYAVLGATLLLAVAGLAATRARRSPAYWGAALFVILLLPVSNLIPVGGETLVASRLLFVPTLGLALCVASIRVPEGARPRAVAAALAGLSLLAASARLATRAHDYRSEQAFWAAEATRNPGCPAVLGEEMRFALEKKRYAAALGAAAEAYTAATAWPDARVAAGAVLGTVQALAGLTRDLDADGLTRLARFCGALADPAAPRATLDHPAAHLDVALDAGPVAARVHDFRALALTLLADLESRRGADEDASRAARASLTACPRCADLHLTAALALARAGAYRDALAALPRGIAWARFARPVGNHISRAAKLAAGAQAAPPNAQGTLEAQRWMELSAWGRAFRAADGSLAADREAGRPPPDRDDRRVLAELAFRAGARDRAEAFLDGAVRPIEARQMMDEWAESMGWAER